MKRRNTVSTLFTFFCTVLATALSRSDRPRDLAQEILTPTGVRGGLAVHHGCNRADLAIALASRDEFLVHCLVSDPDTLKSIRLEISKTGLYGKASATLSDNTSLPYADGIVTLLVSEAAGTIPSQEINRVLAPNGVAFTRNSPAEEWIKTVNPRPDEIDDWTHWLHGPDGNAVSADRIAGPPRHLQWMAGPLWARLHDAPSSTSAMVSAGGRVFYINDEGPAATYQDIEDKWFLVARDAFNGTLLWKRRMPEWGWKQWTANWHARNNQPLQLPKRLVAAGDRLYVTLKFNGPVSELDGATGKTLRTFPGTRGTDEFVLRDRLLVIALNQSPHVPSEENHTPIGKRVSIVNLDTGKILWKSENYTGVTAKTDSIEPLGRLELTLGEKQIFLCDHDAIVALDLETGKENWQTPRPEAPANKANFNTRMDELCVMVYNKGVLLFAQPEGTIGFHSVPGTLYAFDAADGRKLWKSRFGGWVHNTQPNVFVINGTVWIHEHEELERRKPNENITKTLNYEVIGLDLFTGTEKQRFPTRKILNVGHHHRCYRNKATERFLLMSRRGVEFLDVASGKSYLHHWTRGDCHLGVMPANGLLYTTPHPCSCYIDTKLNGFYCLAPENSRKKQVPAEMNHTDALKKGTAYGRVAEPEGSRPASAGEWPAFRADARRSGASQTTVPAELTMLWQTQTGARPGPITAAQGKVFVPIPDQHRITVLDASTGNEIWNFTADGRIDTPPTVFGGIALAGSADGCVYCLRCSDGKLVWKRRVAPLTRLVCSQNQLESAWPVTGSILIENDTAYLAAGRSSYLDGGIYLYELKPETGDVLDCRKIYSPDPLTDSMPKGTKKTLPGNLADILVSDGSNVWMRKEMVFKGENASGGNHLYATGGLRDDSWFNRTTWAIGGNAKHAQLLVFDQTCAYTIEAYRNTSRRRAFTPAAKGYRLARTNLKAPNRAGKRGTGAAGWEKYIPVRAVAMALSKELVFLAGPPDAVTPDDPLGSFEGRMGMRLCAFTKKEGKKLSEKKLESLPVWDGMALSNGQLYLAIQSGKILCLGKKQ